jgi:hypothetical protein
MHAAAEALGAVALVFVLTMVAFGCLTSGARFERGPSPIPVNNEPSPVLRAP